MQVVHHSCCGLDVHKKTVVACVLTAKGKQTRTFGTTTRELLELADWLAEGRISHVAMESTGVYWMPLLQLARGPGSGAASGQCPAYQGGSRAQD